MAFAPDIYQRVVSAKMYMYDNFHNSINLEQISRQAYLSGFHFPAYLHMCTEKHHTSILPKKD